jgi:hypothetical protein
MRAFAIAFLLSGVCFGQQVTVRVVNGSDGQPLPGWKVSVFFVNGTPGKQDVKELQPLQTDSDGKAQFALPQPVPDVLNVYAFPQTHNWYPGSVKTKTSVVMQLGTQSPSGVKTPEKVRGQPGQILILAKPITVWDKIIHTLLGPLERG